MNARSLTVPSTADLADWGTALLVTTGTLVMTTFATGSVDKAVNSVIVGAVTAMPLFFLCCVKFAGDSHRVTCIRMRSIGIAIFGAFLTIAAIVCRTVG